MSLEAAKAIFTNIAKLIRERGAYLIVDLSAGIARACSDIRHGDHVTFTLSQAAQVAGRYEAVYAPEVVRKVGDPGT